MSGKGKEPKDNVGGGQGQGGDGGQGGGADQASEKKQTIIFIVNGEDVPVEANANSPLKSARNKALADSHNTGRPPDEWEIRDERGQLLSPDATVESFNFPRAVRLFLTLRVGAGGR